MYDVEGTRVVDLRFIKTIDAVRYVPDGVDGFDE